MKTIFILLFISVLTHHCCVLSATLNKNTNINEENIEEFDENGSNEEETEVENDENDFGIIGGKKVPISQYAYTAAVMARTLHFGSAIILNKRWVLTSAWLISFEDPKVILIRAGSESAIDKGQTSWVQKMFIHPKYKNPWLNDIGLIKLETPLKFGKNVKAIKIGDKAPKENEQAIISGFGLVDKNRKMIERHPFTFIHDGWLRAASFKTISFDKCTSYYKDSKHFTNLSFCTAVSSSTGPCSFDYGSPLVYKQKLVGMFSGVPICTDPQYPAVYTDVTKLKSWIENTIKDNSNEKELKELYTDIQYHE